MPALMASPPRPTLPPCPLPPLEAPALEAWLPMWAIELPVTAPLRVLLAVAVVVLKALLKEPVEPLFKAAERVP